MNAVRNRRAVPRSAGVIRMLRGAVLFLVLLPAVVSPQYALDWYTLDGGGEVLSETADGRWQLSGTLGQWDASGLAELAGAGYSLSGGFWPVTIAETDLLFKDGFEN